jgi:large repetitive protein
VTGKANKFPLTLDGVPASFFIGDFPFAFVGHAVGATSFTVAAKDAGGDTIVGTYTTPITLTDSDTTGATNISTAGAGAPPAKELLSSSDVARISYNGKSISGPAIIGASAGAAKGSGAFVAHAPVPIFVATGDNAQVYKIPVNCSTAACFVAIGAGFPRVFEPLGVATDSSGSLYVADAEGGRGGAVYKTTQTCTSASCVSTIGGGFVSPQAVAVDGHGNVYVGDFITTANSGAAYKVPAGCTASSCVVKIGGTFGNPNGIAVDGSGNVYVADGGSSPYAQGIYEIPAGCTQASCVAFLQFPNGGWRSPSGVAVDASDNVYVVDLGETTAFEIPKDCGSEACVSTIGGGFSAPTGVAIDASGTLYVSTVNTQTVTYMSPSCASSACVYSLAGASVTYGGLYGIAASPPVVPATVR